MSPAYGAGVQRPMPYVLVGGMAGAGVRWALGEVLTSSAATLLTVNTVGSLILGLATILAQGRTGVRPPSDLGGWGSGHPGWVGVTVGFCGGLTTFSTMAVDLVSRNSRGASILGIASIVIGLTAVLAGRTLARRVDWGPT